MFSFPRALAVSATRSRTDAIQMEPPDDPAVVSVAFPVFSPPLWRRRRGIRFRFMDSDNRLRPRTASIRRFPRALRLENRWIAVPMVRSNLRVQDSSTLRLISKGGAGAGTRVFPILGPDQSGPPIARVVRQLRRRQRRGTTARTTNASGDRAHRSPLVIRRVSAGGMARAFRSRWDLYGYH